ncbi:hypothetical protein SAMN05421867_111137 [Cellulomonas marina]|uniref:Uncharacterized protein n=1 Tax=Cellulomonas marina TaxID=988821 RepID=A0A1I0ZK45_9CELL|nr:hypothetical protein SAMN05421867_111137 [Cellulomonas marina]
MVRRELPDDSGIVEGVDVDPHREDAVGVWWMHSAEDIIVGLGKGRGWELPRSVETVEVVRSVVRQAVAGQIEVGRGRGVTLYRVRTSDGVVREDTHEGWAAFLLSMPWRPKMRWNDAAPYDRD